METNAAGLAPALALRLEIEDFLYREAALVDDRRYDEWLQLFADDLQYRVPIARNLRHDRISDEYLTRPLDVHWIDEDKATLAARVAQIRTGVHWAEEPLSRTARLVTNVRIVRASPSVEAPAEVEVSCRFLVYRNRNDDEEDTLIGKRVDVLRRSGDSWLISERTVYIAQSVLLAKNLSFFV